MKEHKKSSKTRYCQLCLKVSVNGVTVSTKTCVTGNNGVLHKALVEGAGNVGKEIKIM